MRKSPALVFIAVRFSWMFVIFGRTYAFALHLPLSMSSPTFFFSAHPIPYQCIVCTKIQSDSFHPIVHFFCSFLLSIESLLTFTNWLCSHNTYEVWSHTISIIPLSRNIEMHPAHIGPFFRSFGRYPQCWLVQTTFRLVPAIVVRTTTKATETPSKIEFGNILSLSAKRSHTQTHAYTLAPGKLTLSDNIPTDSAGECLVSASFVYRCRRYHTILWDRNNSLSLISSQYHGMCEFVCVSPCVKRFGVGPALPTVCVNAQKIYTIHDTIYYIDSSERAAEHITCAREWAKQQQSQQMEFYSDI